MLGRAVHGLPVAPLKFDDLERYVAPGMISLIAHGDSRHFYYIRYLDTQTITFQTGTIARWNDLVPPKMWLNERFGPPDGWLPTTSSAVIAISSDGFRGLLNDANAVASDLNLGRSCDPYAGYQLRTGPIVNEPPDVYVFWRHHRSFALGCDTRGRAVLQDALRLMKQLGLRKSDDLQSYPKP